VLRRAPDEAGGGPVLERTAAEVTAWLAERGR
jgi:hypothetical protein